MMLIDELRPKAVEEVEADLDNEEDIYEENN